MLIIERKTGESIVFKNKEGRVLLRMILHTVMKGRIKLRFDGSPDDIIIKREEIND